MDRARFLIALALGLAAGVIAALGSGGDVLWPVSGARRLLAGLNPYAAPYPALASDPAYLWLYYPLPALLLCVPVAWLPDRLAIGALCGLSAGLLVWSVAPRRERWPVLVSLPVAVCLIYANPFPLICAAAWSLPWLAPVAVAKPNVALPVLIARPSWRWLPVGLSAALVAASIPLGWLTHLGSHENQIAIATPIGAVAVLCLLRYRDRRARLVLLMACMPLRLSDTAALLFAARTPLQGWLLSAVSWSFLVYPDAGVLVAAAAIIATTAMPQTRRHSSAARMPTARY